MAELSHKRSTLLAPGTDFMEENFSMDQERGWFGDNSSALYLLCSLFLLLLHLFHLRSSGITFQRLETFGVTVSHSSQHVVHMAIQNSISCQPGNRTIAFPCYMWLEISWFCILETLFEITFTWTLKALLLKTSKPM